MERHDLDPISLVFGVAFTALGLLSLAGPVSPLALGWALPLVAVGLGIAIIFTSRRHPPAAPEPPATDGDQGL